MAGKKLSGSSFLICGSMLMLILMGSSSLLSPTVEASGEYQNLIGWIPTNRSNSCKGSTAECLAGGGGGEAEMEEEEFLMMESEISRRMLATNKYISYGALQRNTVPCSRRGASYYNCRPGAQANPYNRGCSAITRCRS